MKRGLHRVAYAADGAVDRFRYRKTARLWNEPWRVIPYRGYGNRRELTLQGRVLAGEGLAPLDRDVGVVRNLSRSWHRVWSREVPYAEVTARFGGEEASAHADDEGYFRFDLQAPDGFSPEDLWVTVELAVSDERHGHESRAVGEILVPPEDAAFGVISDIDDTVVRTGATSYLSMATSVLAQNAWTRPPFPGVSAFYQALFQGGDDSPRNPLFYVSSSPWNIYDMLAEFLSYRKIPGGPVLLRDIGIDDEKFIKAGHSDHKSEKIEHLLATYPELPFILIGDSGQHDPEIYAALARRPEYEGRFRVIYIRSVHDWPGRKGELDALVEATAEAGTDMVIVEDTSRRRWTPPSGVSSQPTSCRRSAWRPKGTWPEGPDLEVLDLEVPDTLGIAAWRLSSRVSGNLFRKTPTTVGKHSEVSSIVDDFLGWRSPPEAAQLS